jgi:hypothetical protein
MVCLKITIQHISYFLGLVQYAVLLWHHSLNKTSNVHFKKSPYIVYHSIFISVSDLKSIWITTENSGHYSNYYNQFVWAVIAQSVYWLAMGWTVRGSNPGGGEIFCTCPHRPYTIGTGSFPKLKRPGRGVGHPPPLTRRLQEKYSDYNSGTPTMHNFTVYVFFL